MSLKKTFEIVFFYMILYVSLLYCYYNYISVYWGYYGFPLEIYPERAYAGLVFTGIVAAFLPNAIRKPSDLLLHVHFVLPILPMLVMYAFAGKSAIFMYFSLICFLNVILFSRIKIRLKPVAKINEKTICRAIFFIVGIQILIVVYFVGFQFVSFDIWGVYEHRRDIADLLPSYLGYLIPWSTKIFLPFLFVISMKKKNVGMASVTILLQIAEFALTQHKSPLFFPFIVYGVYLLSRSKAGLRHLLLFFIFLSLIPLTIDTFGLLSESISGLLIRRTMFTPAFANFAYYDFFSANAHVYLSNSIVTFGFIDYPYGIPYQNLFRSTMWLNTGWIGTSYMHFGFIGMAIFSMFVGLILSLIDNLSTGYPAWFASSLAIVPMFTLFTSADLLTSILTHGILVFALLLYVYPKSLHFRKR